MHLGNFTPDPINWMHIGVEGTIKPGEVVEVDDARGNHILTAYGRKGIVVMPYGCDEDEKHAESLRRWQRFWEEQVVVFNQHNEALKNENKPYVFPTKELQEHAAALKIELVQPWVLGRSGVPGATGVGGADTFNATINELKERQAQHDDRLGKMETGIASILDMLSVQSKDKAPGQDATAPADPDAPAVSDDEIRDTFKDLGKKKLQEFVDANETSIITWPVHLQEEIRDLYMHRTSKDWPLPLLK